MLLKFAKLFEEIQKQPKLDKSSAGFKKVGKDMLKAMGEMEELKPKVQRELGMHTAAAAAVTTAAAATAVADADVDDITAQLERRLKALQPAPAPAPKPKPAPAPAPAPAARPPEPTGSAAPAPTGGAADAVALAAGPPSVASSLLRPPASTGVPSAYVAPAVVPPSAGGASAGPVEAACTIPGGVAPPLTSAASSGLAHIGATAASGLGAMAAAAAALPDPNSPARPARSASDGPSVGMPVAPAGARGTPPPPDAPPDGPPPTYDFANTMYPKVARPLSELPKGSVSERGSAAGASERGSAAGGGGGGAYPRPLGMKDAAPPPEAPALKEGAALEAFHRRLAERKAGARSSMPMGHRERLQRHMALRGFRIKDVPGDNNCQFHALADQLEQVGVSGFTAGKLRKLTVSWLQENGDRPMDNGKVGERTLLRDSVGVENWDKYIREMSQHGVTWGDEATLLAASVLFKAEICIISSVSDDYCHVVTPPDVWKVPLRTRIYLGHYHEFHYVSTRPMG